MRLGHLLGVGLLLLFPGRAGANGAAIPDTVSFLATSPVAGDLAMNTTVGFLLSTNGGASWQWTCHEALIGTAPYTPDARRSPQGSLYALLPLPLPVGDPTRSLWRSADRGCNWAGIASPSHVTIDWLAFQEGGPAALAMGLTSAGSAYAWRSTDGGASFGAPILSGGPGEVFVDAVYAPADPSRAYLSSLQGSPATYRVYVSNDGGATWIRQVVSLPGNPHLLAVDPLHPERVWLRADGANRTVLLSTNAALSFFPTFSVATDIYGFALTAHGATRWVGVRTTNGLYAATSSSLSFTRLAPSPSARCLQASGDSLYLCADPYDPRFPAGAVTTDGAVYGTAMAFHRITGPLSCPSGSLSTTICDPIWPGVAVKLGLATPLPSPSPGNSAQGGGCGCTLGWESSRTSGVSAVTIGVLLVTLLVRRGTAFRWPAPGFRVLRLGSPGEGRYRTSHGKGSGAAGMERAAE